MDMRAIRWAMYGVAAMGMGTLATPAASAAETTLTHVHVCCNSCKKAVDAAITGAGARANIEKNTVTITADDEAGVKKAVAAMLAAGYYGQGAPTAPASDVKAKSVTVEGAHLCCKKCVAAFNKAVKAAGATKTDAEKDEKSVTVEGDLSPKEVQEALHKAGFNATVK